jgi:hypothetical protein
MKVDKNNVNDIVDDYNEIEKQLIFIESFIPWDLPPNVEKCREIRRKRLMKKLRAIVESDQGQDYVLFIDRNKY